MAASSTTLRLVPCPPLLLSMSAPVGATRVQLMRRDLAPIAVAGATTLLVTALSYALPEHYAATGVGLAFLAATWLTALRGDSDRVAHFGLSLGGVLDAAPIRLSRLFREGARALVWAAGLSMLIFPCFWLGYKFWWKPIHSFAWIPPSASSDDLLRSLIRWFLPFQALESIGHHRVLRPILAHADEALGQLFVIALPEEAFYRGYLQTALDDVWGARVRILGAKVGWAIPAGAVLFAIGHFLTEPRADRLAVFFPALLFGWLRARTGGIGAPIALHAMSNIFSALLGRGYGLFR